MAVTFDLLILNITDLSQNTDCHLKYLIYDVINDVVFDVLQRHRWSETLTAPLLMYKR